MKNIVKAIGGAGFLMSGSTMMTWVLSVLDWKSRVGRYGFFHELDVYGVSTPFWIAAVFCLIGVVSCISAWASSFLKED